jgi:hypothetical protein
MPIAKRAVACAAAIAFTACGTMMAQSASVFASGLQNPSKIVTGPNGTLLVTEAGQTPNSGAVSLIDSGGSRHAILSGLPSGLAAPDMAADGPNGLALSGRTLYIANGEGDSFRNGAQQGTTVPNPDGPSSPLFASVLKVTFNTDLDRLTDGFQLQLADHFTLLDGNTVTLDNGSGGKATVELLAAFRPGVPDPRTIYRNSHPYGLALLPSQPDTLYVADAGMNVVRQVSLGTGHSKVLTRFPNAPNMTQGGPPTSEAVPNSVRAYGDQLLVSLLSGFPFAPGASRIMAVDPATGDSTLFISLLSSAIDVVYRSKSDGSPEFFVLEYSQNLLGGAAGSLRVYDTPVGKELVGGLPGPTSMALDESTGNLYITSRTDGTVLKVNVGM